MKKRAAVTSAALERIGRAVLIERACRRELETATGDDVERARVRLGQAIKVLGHLRDEAEKGRR